MKDHPDGGVARGDFMQLSDVENLLLSFPSEVCSGHLLTVIDRWKQTECDAEELFRRGRASLRADQASSSPSTFNQIDGVWRQLETDLRATLSTMTPHEVCRAFGLFDKFLAMKSEGRRRLVSNLRIRTTLRSPNQRTPDQAIQDIRWAQQFFQDQGDPTIRAIQAEARVPPPRKMLTEQLLDDLKQEVDSKGIDLSTERALSLTAKDACHAVQLACLLSHTRGCDLFRGQPVDWNPMPPLFRDGIGEQSEVKRQGFVKFKEWASEQPLLNEFCSDRRIEAIAQHYGIPTSLLDFTDNPRTAAFFATHSDVALNDRPACIYCLTSASLEGYRYDASSWRRFYGLVPEVIRLWEFELYRMEAQEGSFVFVHQPDWAGYEMDIIRFPRHGPVTTPIKDDIYPVIQSEREQLVEAYCQSCK